MTDVSAPAGAAPSVAPGQSLMSARIEEYADALDTFKAMLLEGRELSVILQAVCGEVVSAVAGADMAGITVLEECGEHPETTASTDPRVHDVDADQYRSDEGPCLEAARTRTMVRVRVAEAADRWPTFVSNVSDIGIASYLSAPLILDNKHLGALNIYSYSDHGFSDVDEALVRLFVTAVEAAVWISRRAISAEDEVEGLTTAMKTRATIEQAKGIIMALQGCTSNEAFRILSTQSQQRNIKVADIAASIIDSVPTGTKS
ncbi:GAF and ANTAR domain-containing protein [Rhodococcus fascians]|nr:GAF and ANTAR domain-containing protein [Rhodococcus fascians]MBY4056693.1 GAF and ANTAR domain-containing protein [Rhodococcus fascians]MBY4068076.1 GAF and ANTAR domain-containing protein [Rhodococcus fascians]MBY4401608.1 GAF and ANTAR domain-containing protein [Rhodococcus fascians]MBY4417666.1 GAF and ANTAR domain-containing protein [Rhodococcus fascians]